MTIQRLQDRIKELEGSSSPKISQQDPKFELKHRFEEQAEEIEKLKKENEELKKQLSMVPELQKRNKQLEAIMHINHERLEEQNKTFRDVLQDLGQYKARVQQLMEENMIAKQQHNKEKELIMKELDDQRNKSASYLKELGHLRELNSSLETQFLETSRILNSTRKQLQKFQLFEANTTTPDGTPKKRRSWDVYKEKGTVLNFDSPLLGNSPDIKYS